MADFVEGRSDQAIGNVTARHPSSHKPSSSKLKWVNKKYEDYFSAENTPTFSFTDANATVVLPFIVQGESQQCLLPGLTLFSVSEHRDAYPVVGLGKAGIKGYTQGHRITAGSLAFTLFGSNPFAEVIRKYAIWSSNPEVKHISADELPPFDLILTFSNDKGVSTSFFLRGVKLLDRSQNISVRDIQLTEIYSFMAASCSYLTEKLTLQQPTPITGSRLNSSDWNSNTRNNDFMNAKAASGMS